MGIGLNDYIRDDIIFSVCDAEFDIGLEDNAYARVGPSASAR
jgi:hypothetical protein